MLVQAAGSFDRMGSKAKIADVVNAFGVGDTMSISDLFNKNPKKKTRKAVDPSSNVIQKKPKSSSIVAATPTQPASASTTSPKSYGP